jgi:putative salt-induced outer membrane protein YdiY
MFLGRRQPSVPRGCFLFIDRIACSSGSTASPTARRCWLLTLLGLLVAAPAALAQDPAPPPVDQPATWSGTFGGGLSLTSGNTDSLTYNFAFDLARDSGQGNVLTWTGLYLRGAQNEVVVVHRLSLGLRNEFTFSPRTFFFSQIDYLHDQFKRIDYLIAPAVGFGYKLVEIPSTTFSIDLGGGSVTERNPGSEPRTTGGIKVGETLTHDLNSTAAIKQATTALWNANDLGNLLLTSSIGLATRISTRFQLTVDLIDTYKSRPATAATERNDVNLVIAITAKY